MLMALKELKERIKKNKTVKILCVTDQDELRDLVRQNFGSFFDLFEAISGEEGVKTALERKPDVVLMDLGMHHLSGVDAAREIKKALPQTKIIMLTMYLCDSCPTGL